MTNTTLQTELDSFTGTEQYYPHWSKRCKYTDGVKFLADKAGAHWLIDAIASWQLEPKVSKEGFQVWELKRTENKKAVLSMIPDINQPEIVTQQIEHTDFPLQYIKLYFIDGVLLLPSEY